MLFGFEDTPSGDGDDRVVDEAESAVDPHPARGVPWEYLLAGIAAGLALALAFALFWPTNSDSVTQESLDIAIAEALDARDASVADQATLAYEQIAPSLVGVRATSDDDTPPNIGAGVVINEQGQILTSNHVVADASTIELLFADGSVAEAQIESVDAERDIAVVTTAGRTGVLVPAVLGNARTLQIGDPVYAVGSPLGLTASMSAGVISGLNRDIPFPATDPDAGGELPVLEDLIQFDAAVNQGSSGGPLINSEGQVIGVVTALADPAGQGFFIGIGFAVPIDLAARQAADGPSQ